MEFGAGETSLTFDPRVGETPVFFPNPTLKNQFERYAQEVIQTLSSPNEFTRMVTTALLSRMDRPHHSIADVARELRISVRTVQYRLAREGVHFSDLLTGLRKTLSEKRLREGYSMEQITYLPGYSEASAFRKAFNSWTGMTPREYRDQLRSPRMTKQ